VEIYSMEIYSIKILFSIIKDSIQIHYIFNNALLEKQAPTNTKKHEFLITPTVK